MTKTNWMKQNEKQIKVKKGRLSSEENEEK